MTLQQLKQQASALNIAIETVRKYGDLRKTSTWQAAIAANQPQGIAGDSTGIALKQTCATCPHFKSYNDNGRGECCIFGTVERAHHEMTSDCENAIASQEPEQLQPVVVEAQPDTIGTWYSVKLEGKPVTSILKSAFDGLYVLNEKRFPNLPIALATLGLIATTMTVIQPMAIATEQAKPKPPEKQSPHRGSGRREALRFIDDGWRLLCINDTGKQYEISEEYCTCDGHRFNRKCYHRDEYLHRLAFNLSLSEPRTTPEIKVEKENSFPHTIYRMWCGKQMCGTYFQSSTDGKWLVDVAVGTRDFNRYDTQPEAEKALLAAWNEAERLRDQHRTAISLLH